MAVDVALSWDLSPTTTDEVDGQRVYRTDESSPTFPDDYTEISSLSDSATSYTDSDVTTNTSFTYAVSAYNAAGENEVTLSVDIPYDMKVNSNYVYTLTANGSEVTAIVVNGSSI